MSAVCLEMPATGRRSDVLRRTPRRRRGALGLVQRGVASASRLIVCDISPAGAANPTEKQSAYDPRHPERGGSFRDTGGAGPKRWAGRRLFDRRSPPRVRHSIVPAARERTGDRAAARTCRLESLVAWMATRCTTPTRIAPPPLRGASPSICPYGPSPRRGTVMLTAVNEREVPSATRSCVARSCRSTASRRNAACSSARMLCKR